jgi:AraC-like DNA-binding protein
MPDHTPSSSIGSWALLVSQIIESYGVDSQAIFDDVGVDLDGLRKNNARITNAKIYEVWQQAQVLCDDPYITLRLFQNMKPCAFDTLGMALSVSQHVYDALKRLVRYAKYLNNGPDFLLSETQDEVSLLIQSSSVSMPQSSGLNIEALLGSMLQVLYSIAGDNFKLKAIYFKHDFDFDIKPFENHFQCPVYFSSDHYEMVFEKEGLFSEFTFANSVLTSTLDEWIEGHLSTFNDELVSYKVQKYLLKHLAYDDIDQNKVADHLNLSPRMLQRKLKDEGVSYTELLDTSRQKLAFKLISDDSIPLSELTFILGFTDQSNFSRAFKRWSGSTPHHYRNNK